MLHNSRSASTEIGSGLLRPAHPRRGSRRRTDLLLAVERMEERTLLSTFLVTNTNDSGDGSFRQSILDVNADTASTTADTIDFNIPGSGVQSIRPLSQLPLIAHPVVIDGYSQPGSKPNDLTASDDAVVLIELDGSCAGPAVGLGISGGNSTVMGLAINRFESYGIALLGAGGDVIEGDFIGTDATGSIALGNPLGVAVQSPGNRIGTDGNASSDIPEGQDDYAERNLISGNNSSGIGFGIAIGDSSNVVAGNFIGTDATGTQSLGNARFGVSVSLGIHNRIGSDARDADPAAERNVISGNGGGIALGASADDNVIAGNRIGTDVTGTQPLGNVGVGVVVIQSVGNRIGTDGDGVGDAVEGNVISANEGDGVELAESSNNNVVAGNFIGTDVTGTQPLGNSNDGINVSYGSSSNRIGTDGRSVDNVGERNIISSNIRGIELGAGAPGQGNVIAGNWIGVGSDGGPLGNGFIGYRGGPSGGIGILIEGDSSDQIGGSPALANIIANTYFGSGVVIQGDSIGDSVRANAIYNNTAPIGGLAIDLGHDGGTPDNSHAGQAGPNNWQNYPVLSTAVAGPATRVLGSFNSTPNTTFTLDFYANDPDKGSANAGGEGQYYLGSATVTTDVSGNVGFNASGLGATTPGEWVSATATDPAGNTSEFALDVQAKRVPSVTTLTPSVVSPLAGVDTVRFTASLAGAIAGTGTPGGTVDFVDTTTNTDLGSVALTAGVAVLNASFLALGNHTIVASYSGDGSFLPSGFATTINVIPPASLSGVVFSDFNDDGQVDFGEGGIPGVPITVTGIDDLGHSISLGQVTDGAGAYVFLNLRPGSYTITETQQPTGYTPGIASVGTAGGTVSCARFSVSLPARVNAMNYNYGERPIATGQVHAGQTAGIGFWNNKNGQALIKALNGGVGTKLGDWLAATFPRMFGAASGSNDLAGRDNASIATFFQSRFVEHGEKLDAQVLATALAVYVTDPILDSTGVGTKYGFTVGGNGVATATFSVGNDGAAFGVANQTTMTVMDLLLAADAQAVNGVLYNGNKARRTMANDVFSALNEAGSS